MNFIRHTYVPEKAEKAEKSGKVANNIRDKQSCGVVVISHNKRNS